MALLDNLLPPGFMDQVTTFFTGAQQKINEFEATLARIENRLYQIELDLQGPDFDNEPKESNHGTGNPPSN